MNFFYILNYWVEVFQEQFKSETSDELKMKIVKKFPFQDDPTRTAPYFLIGLDDRREEEGIAVPDDPIEIGGSAWWKVYFKIRVAPKVVTTSDKAYYLVDLLARRTVYVLRSNGLITVPGQGAISMQNLDWNYISAISPKVYGGEREWLSYVDIYFHQRVRETGPFPYGDYPEELEYPPS